MFIFLLVLIFLTIFAPVVQSPLGFFGDLALITAGILMLIGIFNRVKVDISLLYLIYIYVLIFMISICNAFLVTDQIDIDSLISILKPVKGSIYFIAIYCICIFISNQQKVETPAKIYEYILNLVYVCITIHAVIIIAQYMFPSFLDFTYSFVIDQYVLDVNRSFRMPGLTGAGGAQVSAVQGFGFMLGMHHLLIKKNYYLVFLFNAIILESIIMTGRTGFILVIIGILYWVVSVMILVENKKKLKYVLIFIVTISSCVVVYNYLMNVFEENINFNRSVERSFKTYNNYKETGNFSDETIDALSDMYDLPNTIGTILIGDGSQLNNTLGNYDSDIGYVRLWWAYGILGLLAFMYVYLLIGYYITKSFVIKVMGKQNIMFGLTMLLSVFILNYKEVFFLSRITNPIIVFSTIPLYWLVCIDRKTIK